MKSRLAPYLAVSVIVSMAAGATPAHAGVTWAWAQDTVMSGASPGCAHEIAVGPNDVPWVVGCSPTSSSVPDKWIFYFSPGTFCSGGFCLPRSTWTYAGASAMKVSVDLVGDAAIVNSSGHILWNNEGTNGGIDWAANGFYDATANSPPAFGGFVTDAVDLWRGPLSEEAFRTAPGPEQDDSWSYTDLWANGSGSPNTCNSIYRYDKDMGATKWSSPQAGSCGIKIAVFTENNNASTQTPWSLTQAHDVFAYNYSTGGFDLKPGAAIDLTDHYAVGTDNNVYQWNDSEQNWNFLLGWSPAGNPIVRVAHAPAITLTNGRSIGPSHLWALDSAGNIWYAYETSTPQ